MKAFNNIFIFVQIFNVFVPFAFLADNNLHFSSNGIADVIWNTSIIIKLHTRSKLECVTKCATFVSCQTVAYNRHVKTCKCFDQNMAGVAHVFYGQISIYFTPAMPVPTEPAPAGKRFIVLTNISLSFSVLL